MKTPYDAAARWRKNELDTLRRELGTLQARQDELLARMSALEAEVEAEAELAPLNPFSNFHAFSTRKAQDNARIEDELHLLEQEADKLRAMLETAFTDFKTLDIAAERYRVAAVRALASAEQDELDEIAARAHARG